MNFQRIRQFLARYERHLSVFGMAAGFLLDNAALKEINGLPETLLLTFYFLASGSLIIGIHIADTRKYAWLTKIRPWLPLLFQITIGSWYSAFLVFYSHSASLSASWPFLLILLIIFAGTEIFKSYQDRLVFQNAMYFFAIMTYATAVVPLLVGSIGTGVFLLSGAVSLALFAGFFWLLHASGPARLKPASRRIVMSVGAVFLIVNVFYFAHLLPPLPLTLKDIGTYHSIVRMGGDYEAIGEARTSLIHFFGDETVHIRKGNPVYVFSSVFTPIAIKTNLVHRWQHWDEGQKKWVTTSTIRFPISGGRDGGYRGFSYIPAIPEGRWRVSVETPNGGLIGRISFTVAYTAAQPPLVRTAL